MREKIETKPIITKQLAVDIWNASLKEVAEHDNQHDRVNVVGVLLDRAMTLNELTGCLADDPVASSGVNAFGFLSVDSDIRSQETYQWMLFGTRRKRHFGPEQTMPGVGC